MTNPFISIITVVYNGVQTIEQTIQSVGNLEYSNIEYIIIDGGSTDGTIEIIKRYQSKIHFFVSEPDSGIYDAMNKGIRAATGDWINFMNCGDYFASPEALNFFEGEVDEMTDIVYGDAIIRYNTFDSMLQKIPIEQFWKRMPFCHQATFVRTRIMKQHPFDTSYRLSSDYDFLYNAYLSKNRFQYVAVTICFFDYTQGASVQNSLISVKERKHIVLKHGFHLRTWLYYSMLVFYIKAGILAKRVLGKHYTELLIRTFKK